MIEGHGDIASVLPNRPDLTFFACGVSNSQETREAEYEREKARLMAQDTEKHLVYFSSLAIFYGTTRYVEHKKEMERLVRAYFRPYTIIRLGNIDWGTNPHTLINYLKANPEAPIQDTYRYVVGKEEFLHWVNLIPPWNVEMNIPGKMMKVADIKKEYVK